DQAGSLVEQYEYDVYGHPSLYDASFVAITSSAVDNPYLFQGRRWDAETDQYYYRARQYDVAQGRFLQRDPLGLVDGPNLYAFVGNNPVNRVDPLGTAWRNVTHTLMDRDYPNNRNHPLFWGDGKWTEGTFFRKYHYWKSFGIRETYTDVWEDREQRTWDAKRCLCFYARITDNYTVQINMFEEWVYDPSGTTAMWIGTGMTVTGGLVAAVTAPTGFGFALGVSIASHGAVLTTAGGAEGTKNYLAKRMVRGTSRWGNWQTYDWVLIAEADCRRDCERGADLMLPWKPGKPKWR
ncbi:MAG: RHS repeat-associated core domain-containing protein, partial [Bacteroidota bacterium]